MKIVKHLLFAYLILSSLVFYGQKENDYWNKLLSNDFNEAHKVFSKNEDINNSIEALLTNEILRNENGFISNSTEDFIEKFLAYKDFEYYLYAFWNSPFLFDNYISTGFHNSNLTKIKAIDESIIENKTIKYALKYLKGIAERDRKNFEGYFKYSNEIDVIKEWQYCGVFENLNKSGFYTQFEPEYISKDDVVFDANSNGLIHWYTPNKDFEKETYKFYSNHSEYGYGVNYAQTFIKSDNDKRVQLRFGNSSSFKVWLNDVLIFSNNEDVSTDLDAFSVSVNLSKGINRLLIKNAESNGTPYFIARVCDVNGNKVEGVTYSNEYSNYKKGSISIIKPEINKNSVEVFFENKVNQNPENLFYKYCLIQTYFRNQKYNEANKIINPLLDKYPKSSFLRILKINAYSYEKNFNAVNELNKNIFLENPNYYYSLLKKVSNYDDLSKMSIPELEQFLKELESSTDSKIIKLIAKFVLDARNEDLISLRQTMEKINEVASDRVEILKRFIPLYNTIFQDQERTISELKNVLDTRFSPAIANILVSIYDKEDKKEEVIKIYKYFVDNYPSENDFLFNLIEKLHLYKRYEESKPYINQALKNYPFSFKAMEYMGNALYQLNNKEEALKYYEKSLAYNNGNIKLLEKIETIKKSPNLINKYSQTDVYDYVEKNRNKYKDNNYGSNILLDSKVYQLYNSGTIKGKTVYIYEITSENGIESYKEYDLGLTGNYSIDKSEIIKKDKTIIPAEKTNSKFVFNGLEIGDVILISYETRSTNTGRFYKDFVDTYQFDSESFCLKTNYTFITPKDFDFNYKITNGDINYAKNTEDNYDVHQWILVNAKELPKSEDFMPSSYDVARHLHISTIDSWNDISTWYSDLVRSQAIFSDKVEEEYKKIFPEKNIAEISDEEKAKRIYYYIMNNFTYSFVDFKQNGFIPQKPEKTITSKLGDCKDFSTLFSTFARQAGLDVNLVLVLTSDYGENALILPSQDFNHCIVKVNLNDKNQYLELTDKTLPFKSYPTSLANASALEIPYKINSNKSYDLIKLPTTKDVISKLETEVSIKIDENETQHIIVDSKISGDVSSGYFEILNKSDYELLKKDIEDDFKYKIGDEVIFDTITNISSSIGNTYASYRAKLRLKNKVNKMGSISFFNLPHVFHAYNAGLINLEKRNYPIFYQTYENTDFYSSVYRINVPEGKKIIEVPENQLFSYKNHKYEVTFEKLDNNTLKIYKKATIDFTTIKKEEYVDFKNYVEKVLKAKDILIGYK